MAATPRDDSPRSTLAALAPLGREALQAALCARGGRDRGTTSGEIAQTLVGLSKGGDTIATKELLLRTLGRPVEADLFELLEAMLPKGAGR